ncbi:MAG: hypothetical protein HPY78_06155 [Brevinematales bacterium]|nr:hypothetical protein [Brevinematales bacterium]
MRFFWLIAIPSVIFARVEIGLYNQAYAYNGESGTAWEETRTTLTYFENHTEPYLVIEPDERIRVTLGIGFVVPFQQEYPISDVFVRAQTRLTLAPFLWLYLGSLEKNHGFIEPILDPLTEFIPRIRLISLSQVPIDYEHFPKGRFSHGFYEYGAQLRWMDRWTKGELYMNWQLADTTNHRERFDVGLVQEGIGEVPLYMALHYWHNGGHEHEHIIGITENYVGAIGWEFPIVGKRSGVYYLVSYYLPDRDSRPELNQFGQALYTRWELSLGNWRFIPNLFLTSTWIDENQWFISIEGDPFYRVPLYAGLNIRYEKEIAPGTLFQVGFVNGAFLPNTHTPYDWKMIRYDQLIRVELRYTFYSTKE